MAPVRILSLDGGGVWALLQAMALGKIYEDAHTKKQPTGREILADFDYVVACSGGSLVLASLLMDMTPSDIVEKFFLDENKRRMVFAKHDSLVHTFGLGLSNYSRYSTEGKRKGLARILGEVGRKTLEQCAALVSRPAGSRPLRIIITAYDVDRHRARFFRSDANSRAGGGAQGPSVTLLDAVHATSTAPIIYFDEPAKIDGVGNFWDGGVAGYNNPVLAGVTEAIANARPGVEDDRVDRMQVLSIGTGTVRRPLYRGSQGDLAGDPALRARFASLHPDNFFDDIGLMAKSIIDDPPDVATFHAFLMMRHDVPTPFGPGLPGDLRLVRLNPMVQPIEQHGGWRIPDGFYRQPINDNGRALGGAEFFERLANLDMDATEQEDVGLVRAFGKSWVEGGEMVSQPIRQAGDAGGFVTEIGHDRFETAVAHWRRITS